MIFERPIAPIPYLESEMMHNDNGISRRPFGALAAGLQKGLVGLVCLSLMTPPMAMAQAKASKVQQQQDKIGRGNS